MFRSGRVSPRTAALLIVLLFVLDRAAGVGYLLPGFVVEDERLIQEGAVRMVRGLSLDPGSHKYPQLMYALTGLAYGAAWLGADIKAVLHIDGTDSLMSRLSGYPFDFTSTMVWGRLLVAGLGAVALLLLFRLGRREFGEETAVLAVLFTAFAPAFLFSTLLLKNDVLVVIGSILVVMASLRVLERGGRWDYVLAGAAAGFCLAAKYHIVAFVPILAAHRFRRPDLSVVRSMLAPAWLITIPAAIAVFALLSPYTFLDIDGLLEQGVIEWAIQNRLDPLFRRSTVHWWHLPVLFQLVAVGPLVMGIPLYVLSLAGLVKKLDFSDRRKLVVMSYPAGLLVFMILLSDLGAPHLYVSMVPFLCLFAASRLRGWIESEHRLKKLLAVAAAVAISGYNLFLFHSLIGEEDRVIRESAMEMMATSEPGLRDAALVPYYPNPDIQWTMEFYPQYQLNDKSLKEVDPDRLLVHHAFYIAFVNNPEVYTAPAGDERSRPMAGMLTTYLRLRGGQAGYREAADWRASVTGGGVYEALLPDLKGVRASIYIKSDGADE